jgi:transposase-like protein
MARCPYCKSENVIWRGYRYNRNSKKRMMFCNKCKRKFTPNDGFLRMRFRPDDIEKALNLYSRGFSTSQVVIEMKKRGVKVSRWTIILWTRKYRVHR